jgi:adenylate cyclase
MKWNSLRAQLFASIGAILLLVAVMSYVLPEYFIRRDLDKATAYIQTFFDKRSEDEKAKLTKFFKVLKTGLLQKISIVLLSTVLFSLLIGLLLLTRISKKITHPITLLAKASKKITTGEYEQVKLPAVHRRHDEIQVLVHSFHEMVKALRDREKIRGVLNKVVSKEIASELLSSNIKLAGEERVVTMLFSDIRGFTHLSEGLSPDILIGILNDYMTRMCHVIDETHGVVDKFVGDEIMALYGAPIPLENHGRKAIESALLMREQLKKWNEEHREKGWPKFEVGFSVHTGLVYSGNMGAENRLNYTVIGANVNLAARLCGAAKPMQIIVSEATWKEVKDLEIFKFEKLPLLELKGIEDGVQAYEVTI